MHSFLKMYLLIKFFVPVTLVNIMSFWHFQNTFFFFFPRTPFKNKTNTENSQNNAVITMSGEKHCEKGNMLNQKEQKPE